MKTIRIRDVPISEEETCFIIAEADANHNRELDTAKIEKPWW